MKIQRFVASNLRGAMQRVRDAQGPEAVILLTHKVEEGVEVVTAQDYDQRAVHEAVVQAVETATAEKINSVAKARPLEKTRRGQSLPGGPERVFHLRPARRSKFADMPVSPVSKAQASTPPPTAVEVPQNETPAGRPGTEFGRPPSMAETTCTKRTDERATQRKLARMSAHGGSSVSQPILAGVRRELGGLREILEGQLASLAWNEATRRQPLRARALRRLASMDIDPDVANEIAAELPGRAHVGQLNSLLFKHLGHHLAIGRRKPWGFSGITAFVGPTGVGKTTTIAKLAAQAILHCGAGRVALINADRSRVGAGTRLDRYAQILRVPAFAVQGADELQDLLHRLSGYRAVFVDSAGMAASDPELAGEIDRLRAVQPALKAALVVAACAQPKALETSVLAYQPLSLSGCILTKLDEAPSLGGAISVLIRHRLKLLLTTNGQRVPEDVAAPDLGKLLREMDATGAEWDDETMVSHDYLRVPAGAAAGSAS